MSLFLFTGFDLFFSPFYALNSTDNMSSRGRGGRNSNRGGRGGRSGGRGGRNHQGSGGGGKYPSTALQPCQSWTTTGNCTHAANCRFAHVVTLHKVVDASSPMPDSNNNNNNNYNNNRYNNNNQNNSNACTTMAPVKTVAIWETNGQIQIFTGANDGFWRLWNTSNFSQLAEKPMLGPVECLKVVSNFLFCGFQSPTKALPGVGNEVGQVHAWNLAQTSQPPQELNISPPLLPYAHNQKVTVLEIATEGGTPKIISGAADGSIRVWKFENSLFALEKSLPGHTREVTGLCLIPGGSLLWSASKDGSLRIWDLSRPADAACQFCITSDTPASNPQQPAPGGAVGVGHTKAVTALILFSMDAGTFLLSSSLDGTIKAWNATTGACVASESHGEGVVSLSLAADTKGTQVLLIGLESGNLMCRNLVQTPKAAAFSLLFCLSKKYTAGHDGAVHALAAGPSSTFYSTGNDGKLMVWQFTGDLGLQ
jgi:WD40 repeat protein